MAQFLVPLFLSCVLLVVFQPLHRWLVRRLPTSPAVAAAITTVLIVLVVLCRRPGSLEGVHRVQRSITCCSTAKKPLPPTRMPTAKPISR